MTLGTIEPVRREKPSRSASLRAFLSTAMVAARRARGSCHGDLGFHCWEKSSHHVAGGITWASRSLESALMVAASTPAIREPMSAPPVFSLARRVVRSGTPLMTSVLIDGFLRQYCSLASRTSSTPGVCRTTPSGPSPTGGPREPPAPPPSTYV